MCVIRVQSWSERGGGVGGSGSGPAVVVSGLPAVNPGAWGPEGRCSDLSLLPPVAWGGGAGSQDPGRPVQSLRAPTSASTPQPRVLLRLCCDPGEDCQGTLVTRSTWFVRGRSSGVWGPQSLTFSQGAPIFSCFPVIWVDFYAPVRSSLALSRADNEFPKFSEFTLHPQGQIPSQIHSIIINYLSSVVHFKQTQCFNCLSFSSQSLRWLFFPFFFFFFWSVNVFHQKKAKNNHLKLLFSTVWCLSSHTLSWAQTSNVWKFLLKLSGSCVLSGLPLLLRFKDCHL